MEQLDNGRLRFMIARISVDLASNSHEHLVGEAKPESGE